ncbi:MAG TPA: DUF2282 domain-containing protein [Thiobacillaceae bacterium]|nr:DUF2282 domain-containing protein [Thiobacillaceae bacterium]HNA81977.1 DUF2282 domain-containing protein [Thiobacillaceae bacterium]HNF88247.1 DUF2282 domain-containing protein [Thiobacillaceae bacterium]HNH88646.1 DUF2282 domain-containing protein [Thiobacillaceae bacterium]HNI07937.1 DUF2282 domain-containing protein [Thiobacillaceae bacterium]
MTRDELIRQAIAGALALGVAAGDALADRGDFEKCAGVAKAGKNDCGTSKTSCAGTAKADRDPEAWVLVPRGTCLKLAGGTVVTDPNARAGGAGRR